MKKNPHEKIYEVECVCCGKPVMVDQWRQGRCQHCRWFNVEHDLDTAYEVHCENLISLIDARQLIAEGKPLKPTIDGFVEAWKTYGEFEFHLNGRRYGVIKRQGEIKFYEWDVKGSIQSFPTIEDFRDNAHIGGVLLKDLWDGVEGAGVMRG